MEDSSPNYRLEKSETKGRYFVASRHLQPGDTVLIEEPYALTISDMYREVACAFCGQLCTTQIFATSPVDRARYCSQECLQGDYSVHSLEIEAQREVDELGGSSTCRLVMRIASNRKHENLTGAIKNKKVIQKEHPAIGKSNIFSEVKTLEAANSFVSPDSKDMISVTAQSLVAIAGKHKLPLNLVDAEHFIYAIHSNAHQLFDDEERFTAVGLFPMTSMINHSCHPNCAHYFEYQTGRPPRLVMKVIREVEEGEELCYSYVRLYQSTSTRRKQLTSSYSFICDCVRCNNGGIINEVSELQTLQDDSGLGCTDIEQIEDSMLEIDDCEYDESDLSGSLQQLQSHIASVESGDYQAFQSVIRILSEDKRLQLISPLHVLLLQTYLSLVKFIANDSNSSLVSIEERKIATCLGLLSIGAIFHFTHSRQYELGRIENSMATLFESLVESNKALDSVFCVENSLELAENWLGSFQWKNDPLVHYLLTHTLTRVLGDLKRSQENELFHALCRGLRASGQQTLAVKRI